MEILLSAHEMAKSFGPKPLFSGLNLSLHVGDRLGLVGRNGVGKSTLLKIFAGLLEPDEGKLSVRRGLRINYVPQFSGFPSGLCVGDYLLEGIKSSSSEQEHEVSKLISRLGLPEWNTALTSLSGGWQRRVLLARSLLGQPELLLLDEPSNHLDWQSLAWLESFLKMCKCAWVMVSHDRYLLDRCVSQVAELEPNGIFMTKGSFTNHRRQQAERHEVLAQQSSSLQNKLRREESWLREGVRARGTKAKYRQEQVGVLQDKLADLRLQSLSLPSLNFKHSNRKTKKLVEVEDLHFSYSSWDERCLKGLSFIAQANEIIGVVGPNGSAKSTLLKILHGDLSPSGGKVKLAQDLKVLYFDQHRENLPESSLAAALSLNDLGHDRGHVYSIAKNFGFSHEQLESPVSKLSGGERARAIIARLLQQEAELLLLDEPTNDLDLDTLEILESALQVFPGTIFLVTHDRYMLQSLCQRFILLRNGDAVLSASFDQCLASFAEGKVSSKSTKPKSAKKAKPKKPQKLSYKERLEYEGMEAKIMAAEAEMQRLVDLSQSAEAGTQVFWDLEKAEKEVESLYTRWNELEDLVQSFANAGIEGQNS